MQTKKHYDIIIIGSGLVGASLANLLADEGLNIAIIDKRAPTLTLPETGYSPRVSAITLGSENRFKQCGIWSNLLATNRISPYQQMQVWDSSGSGEINFSSEETPHPHLGCIIENTLLQRALLENLPHVDQHFSCQLEHLQSSGNLQQLTLQDGRSMYAKLIVGADGAHSWLRSQCQLPITEKPYGHDALVCHVKTEKPHQATAYQCFTETGPLAFLPLAHPNWCSIVWSSPPDKTEARLMLDAETFHHQLGLAFELKLGSIIESTKRFSFPLVERHAKRYVKAGIALIGDAAHTIHPLAGQGVNLGIADANCLSQTIQTALNQRYDFASYLTLRRYERARKSHNLAMIASMQGFKTLFGSEHLGAKLLRNIGLNACNRSPLLKNWFINAASY